MWGTIEDFIKTNEKGYDLIYCFELIEHLFDPISFIKGIKKMLDTGGFIYMTTPNYYGFDFLTLCDKYRNLFGPNHLNYFNQKSIEIILNKAGFSLVYYKTKGVLDVDIVRNYFNRGEVEMDNFWKYVFDFKNNKEDFFKDFQKLLIKHNLSGNSEFLAVRRKQSDP